MNCPRCNSDKVHVQIIQQRKYGSFLTFIVRVILFFWVFIVWLLSLLIRTSKIKNKTVAVCSNCGNTWTPKPRKDLARKRSIEKKAANSERRSELIESAVKSKFWQNEYFGYFMIFLLAPFGIFLMYKYNDRLSRVTKKRIAVIALGVWIMLIVMIAIFGGASDPVNETNRPNQPTLNVNEEQNNYQENSIESSSEEPRHSYLSSLRKCTVMEAIDVQTTGVGRKSENVFNDARDTCNWMFTDIYSSNETDFASSVNSDWDTRHSETLEGKSAEYYLSILGW